MFAMWSNDENSVDDYTYNNAKIRCISLRSMRWHFSMNNLLIRPIKMIRRRNTFMKLSVFMSIFAVISLTILQLRYSYKISGQYAKHHSHQDLSSIHMLKENRVERQVNNHTEKPIVEESLERNCISPEETGWIFDGNSSKCSNSVGSSKKQCELCNIGPSHVKFHNFLIDLSKKIEIMKRKSCHRLVVYSVAFGASYINSFKRTHPTIIRQYHQYHNECFFVFSLDEKIEYQSDVYKIKFLKSKDMSEVCLVFC